MEDFQTEEKRGSDAASMILLTIAVILWSAIGVAMLLMVPRFVAMFEEMQMGLPTLTRMALRLGRIPIAIPIVIGLIAKELLVKDSEVNFFVNIAATVLAAFCAVFLIVALFLPMANLMQALQ